MDETHAWSVAVRVTQQRNGRYACQLTPSIAGNTTAARSFDGQTAKHAVANAMEDMARSLRLEVESEQNVDWEAVDRTSSGAVVEKRFHLILHYERLSDEESKFDALTNLLNGNTVVENAEVTIIQVDHDSPDLAWKRRNSG